VDDLVKRFQPQRIATAIANSISIHAQVDMARGYGEGELSRDHLNRVLDEMSVAIDEARLKNSKTEFQLLVHAINEEHIKTPSEIGGQLRHLAQTMITEIYNSCLCMIVDAGKEDYWEKPELFGPDVARVFPDAADDIEEAGNCYTAGRNTACVFHLMRAVEAALRQWVGMIGAPLTVPVTEANIQDILNAADKHLKALEQQPKTPQRAAELEYFGNASVHFRAIKDAWRNHVSHGKKFYGDAKARFIMDHVREFMNDLASGPPAAP
jgi:hypothetical protein